MSKSLSDAASTQFDGEVKHAYQGAGMLRPCVRVKTGVIGGTHTFRKMGKGIATARIPQTDVVPMNVTHTVPAATLTDWNAPEYTDIFDQAEVNFDERQELAETIAGAIGRREDQMIIDALDAATAVATVGNDIGGTDSNLNVAKLRKAMMNLDNQGAPATDRYYVGSVQGKEALLGETEPTSSDYNTVKALVQGEINTFLGFFFKWIESRDEGGLTIDGSSDRTTYAYHGGRRGAMGLAVGSLPRAVEVNYIAEKTSWLANGLLKAGAKSIDDNGIVDVTCRES